MGKTTWDEDRALFNYRYSGIYTSASWTSWIGIGGVYTSDTTGTFSSTGYDNWGSIVSGLTISASNLGVIGTISSLVSLIYDFTISIIGISGVATTSIGS